ncbi:cystinosin homolog [Euwallacea fornicatus]|uniref:cystinosin homolog n=1 Tax=Euwallacea fornicatus TaxID=995702 RepID=UPI00338D7FB5
MHLHGVTPALLIVLTLAKYCVCDSTLRVDKHEVTLKLHENKTVFLITEYNFTTTNDSLNFIVQHTDIAGINPTSIALISLQPNESKPLQITATGAGKTDIYSNTTNHANVENIYFKVTVFKAASLNTISTIIGWVYFVAWSISFYPQAYINWKRKSVIGLNFDFLSLNIVGFILYSVFNLGLYLIPEIKEEYSVRYPRGLNPVQVNDIFFAVHAVILTSFTIYQCLIYERADQRVSITARVILAIFGVFMVISIFLASFDVIHWLDFLYFCSYVKLTITLIKYVPQAYMNYRRKSTSGWSIGNILLDFTGGMLSMLQMILNAYNYDDWVSIFGDPTKFGLGLFSVLFDIFFMVQHYVFYKNSRYEDH